MDVIARINQIGSDRNVDLSIWGWGYAYEKSWKVKITLTSQGDKHEMVGSGEDIYEAATNVLIKYDQLVKALPTFNPNLALEHQPEPDF